MPQTTEPEPYTPDTLIADVGIDPPRARARHKRIPIPVVLAERVPSEAFARRAELAALALTVSDGWIPVEPPLPGLSVLHLPHIVRPAVPLDRALEIVCDAGLLPAAVGRSRSLIFVGATGTLVLRAADLAIREAFVRYLGTWQRVEIRTCADLVAIALVCS